MTTAAPAALPVDVGASSTRDRFAQVVRRFSAITAAAALAGLVVGGVGGRLAILLLARLNPTAAGVTSDDGFTMGQLDVVNWALRAPLRRVAPVLLVWVLAFPLLPLLVALTAGWWAQDAVRRTPTGRRALSWPAGPWVARALLAALFVLSATRLAGDVAVLT